MTLYSTVKNLSVVTITEGNKVGIVDEMRVDPQSHKVSWLRVRSGGLFGGDEHWVPSSVIVGLGQDLVTIRSESDMQDPDKAQAPGAEAQHGRQISGSRVVTDDGRFLGEIHDFSFSSSTFAITELVIRQGNLFSGQQTTIRGDRILTVGSNIIIVSRELASDVEQLTRARTQSAPPDEDTGQMQAGVAASSWTPAPETEPSGEPVMQHFKDAAGQTPTEQPPETGAEYNPAPDTEPKWTNVPPDEANHLGPREAEEPDLDKDAPEGGPTIR
jgi:uncharacterized protein YrrD